MEMQSQHTSDYQDGLTVKIPFAEHVCATFSTTEGEL